jgi:dihydrofolate reductase
MPKLVARCTAISLDGFSAAKGQALDAPFGKDGPRLMEWAFVTKYFAKMTGQESGTEGLDNDFFVHSNDNIGATIMGRNMFGPQRGRWPNEDWKGWWGPNPPYHHPCAPSRRLIDERVFASIAQKLRVNCLGRPCQTGEAEHDHYS